MNHVFAKFLKLAAICCLSVLAVLLQVKSADVHARVISEDDRFYLPAAKWLRVFSLGFNEAAADLVWIKTIVYFGQRVGSSSSKIKGRENFTVNYLTTAVELDPRFRRAYTAGSALTLFQNLEVTEKTVNAAMELLERGVRAFPGDGEILFDLGVMHYYEMRPFLPADETHPKTKYHEELGAELIARAALMPGAPPYARLLSSSLLSKEGMNDLIVEHLKTMLLAETNPKIRKTLAAKLTREIGATARRDIAATEKYHALWKQEFPFIDFDLFLIIYRPHLAEELIDPLYYSRQILKPDSGSLAGAGDD